MKILVETERLLLRELLPSDKEGIFHLDSDMDVHEFLGKNPIKTIEEAQNIIDFVRLEYQENGIGRWAVILKETNEFIGWAGLKLVTENINGHQNFYDLGYRFIKYFWQKGYGFEAAKACLEYAFYEMKLQTVYAHTMVGNEGSKRILEKIGMKNTGTFFHGDYECLWFELNKYDYQND
jgi:RimJ/RimL family protein N-acetyltransferase